MPEPNSTGTHWCARCTKWPQGGEGVGKCQCQALPQPVLPRQPSPSTAARDTVPAWVPLATSKPPPQLLLQSGQRVRSCWGKLSRIRLARWDPCLDCQHHLTRFNLKLLLKKSKSNKEQKYPTVLDCSEKNLPQHGWTQPRCCLLGRQSEAPRTSLLLGVSAEHNTPRRGAGPGGQGSSVQCHSSHEPREEEEQSCLFSRRKKNFPQLPLWFRRVQGHQAPTHTRPCCLLWPGSWSRRSGMLPAGTEQSRSAWARGQHRSSQYCGARCQHTGALRCQPGGTTVPSPETPCPS